MLDKEWFNKMNKKIREAYRTHVFTKALDVDDKPFSSSYSEPYNSKKLRGDFKRFTKAKINAPVLTGDLTRDFATIKSTTSRGFTFGWSSQGEKIAWLEKNKRYLTTEDNALPKSIAKDLEIEADKQIKIKLGPSKTNRHKIGK